MGSESELESADVSEFVMLLNVDIVCGRRRERSWSSEEMWTINGLSAGRCLAA